MTTGEVAKTITMTLAPGEYYDIATAQDKDSDDCSKNDHHDYIADFLDIVICSFWSFR